MRQQTATKLEPSGCGAASTRRGFLRAGWGVGLGAVFPGAVGRTLLDRGEDAARRRSSAAHSDPDRILVVVELSGGNDGLDTLVPYGDDAYHRARPTLRHAERDLLRLDDYLALPRALGDLWRLWRDGLVAIVQGCGYPDASRSHFSAIEAWHTAAPSDPIGRRGWIGRLADALWPQEPAGTLVNLAKKPSLALRSRIHAPVVFSDPERLVRAAGAGPTAWRARDAIRDYRTPVEYANTSIGSDLRKIAALIAARFPARVYYASLGGFDTHATQASGRPPLMGAVGAALRAFHDDLLRLGRGEDVATLMFSEFGRALKENASLGTDHGAAAPVVVLGAALRPGLYGRHPSLTALDPAGGLERTTDFRRVYTTLIEEWLGAHDARAILGGRFEPLGIFA